MQYIIAVGVCFFCSLPFVFSKSKKSRMFSIILLVIGALSAIVIGTSTCESYYRDFKVVGNYYITNYSFDDKNDSYTIEALDENGKEIKKRVIKKVDANIMNNGVQDTLVEKEIDKTFEIKLFNTYTIFTTTKKEPYVPDLIFANQPEM
ncbi:MULTISPECIES: hypothetical protein [Bacillus cereus group]|nr:MULTISPECIES: hypothetical protein [Bacillus cereus group]MDX5808602.1 hypothetical protein [Bacillus cereus group sp. BfR-BA-02730]